MPLLASILSLRHDARLLKLPPYLSAFCIAVGIIWLLLLPLNGYSRNTYVSENALLPGQVNTYFTGSEHHVFRAYRQEVYGLNERTIDERSQALATIFRDQNLKVAVQKYNYTVSNHTIANHNVYAIIQGPRADATEAMVMIAAWKNMADEFNTSGVSLLLALARYFKRWSLWSKDVIFLIPGDSTSGPQAWVDAYHNGHDERYVESLKLKSGALQAAVAIDYPAGPWGHRYDKLHVVYDGINGQLPNLDLFNTAVQIADGQNGINCVIQGMYDHDNHYPKRLRTMLRGMLAQGMGHATGPHSSFIPYHVDAITLATHGDGWHDEMTLGRTIESLFRSLNNILEHLHQSFFFYLLLQASRFVSIGTYLPSAMLIAVNFSITAMALWVKSGQILEPIPGLTSTKPKEEPSTETTPEQGAATDARANTNKAQKGIKEVPVQVIKEGDSIAIVPSAATIVIERRLFVPLALVLAAHLLSIIPLYTFNHWDADRLFGLFLTAANVTSLMPLGLAWFFVQGMSLGQQELILMQCFSLLLLGMFLATLATLNFSLSFLIGVLTAPLSFTHATNKATVNIMQLVLLAVLNPVMVVQLGTKLLGGNLAEVLIQAAQGWHIWGQWTQVVVWLVWFPAWLLGTTVLATSVF